jgi:flagellar protein FliT
MDTEARKRMPPEEGHDANAERCAAIGHYEAIAASSRRMLDAARREDWDEVAHEEESCRALILALKRAHAAGTTPIGRRQKLVLMRAMLADDAEVRDLAEPWLARLQTLLGGRGSAPVANR